MTIPYRGNTGLGTYFITASTFQKQNILQSERIIKGDFSFRANKELGFIGEMWQQSFYDHRVRDLEEYERCRHYIHHNPVKRGLIDVPAAYPYSSAYPGFDLDEVPQRLKPHEIKAS